MHNQKEIQMEVQFLRGENRRLKEQLSDGALAKEQMVFMERVLFSAIQGVSTCQNFTPEQIAERAEQIQMAVVTRIQTQAEAMMSAQAASQESLAPLQS